MNFPEGNHYGMVAQELEQVFPELVVEGVHPGDIDPETGEVGEPILYKGVKYVDMIPLLVQSIQEQQLIIEEKEQRIISLEERLSNIEALLELDYPR